MIADSSVSGQAGRLASHPGALPGKHQSRCELHLSYRATQRRIEQYGARLSLGWVYASARDYECPKCAEQPTHPAGQAQSEPARVHGTGGMLTGQVTPDG